MTLTAEAVFSDKKTTKNKKRVVILKKDNIISFIRCFL